MEGTSTDGNGGLHAVAQIVYGYGKGATAARTKEIANLTAEQLETQFFHAYARYLGELVEKARGRNYFILAFDGKAPRAKVNQQRGRRFMASLPDSEKVVVLGYQGQKVFDSAAITPGTEFMKRVDLYVQSWLAANREQLPPLVIYSSHLVPGEGEHKIMAILRQLADTGERGQVTGKPAEAGKPEEKYLIAQGGGYHGIYGLDADLCMLSLLSPKERILLIREDFTDIVNIDALKIGVYNDLTSEFKEKPSQKLVIQDYVLMVFFVGNDFLPHMMCFEDMKVAMDTMFKCWRQLGGNTLTNEDGSINWTALANFIYLLGTEEEALLKHKASMEFKYPSTILDAVTVKKEAPPDRHYIEHGTFRKQEKRYTIESFDYGQFRTLWYNNALGPRTTEGKLSLSELGIKAINAGDVEEMCRQYIYGLQWILQYYIGGPISQVFVYRYAHCPMLTDLAQVLISSVKANATLKVEDVLEHKGDVEINLLHLQLAVLPPASAGLIRSPYNTLILTDGALADMAPTRFIIEREGKDKDWQGVPILPPLNMDRIVEAVNRISNGETPEDLKEEKNWVSRLGERIVIPYMDVRLGSARGRGFDFRGRGGFVSRGRGSYEPRGGFGRGGFEPRGRGGFEPRGGFIPRGRGSYEPRGRGGFDRGGRGFDRGRGGFERGRGFGRGGFERGVGGISAQAGVGGIAALPVAGGIAALPRASVGGIAALPVVGGTPAVQAGSAPAAAMPARGRGRGTPRGAPRGRGTPVQGRYSAWSSSDLM
ncbi:XRN 5-3 exoribonuclease [uncultured virus]|nr:XRN 5-3 exoribonuclease [uncultured virus]